MATILRQDIILKFLTDERYLSNFVYIREIRSFGLYHNKENYWQILTKEKIQTILYDFVEKDYPKKDISPRLLDDLSKLLILKAEILNQLDYRYIAFTDCLFDTKEFKKVKHDKFKYAFFKVGFGMADSVEKQKDGTFTMKPTPVFDYFLATTLVTKDGKTDPELIQVVKEMMGFYFFPNLKQDTLFFLSGGGANGKSVLMNIIKTIITKQFYSTLNLDNLTNDKFMLPAIGGKIVNICADDESRYIRSDRFKSLISGEEVHAQRKFQDSFAFKPRTKFLFSTNQTPTFENLNPGLRRRIRIIPFNRTFAPKEQDKTLFSELKKEIPMIFAHAMHGVMQLKQNNYEFSHSTAMAEEMVEFENDVSNAMAFFRETYVLDDNAFLSNQEIYEQYRDWCLTVGCKSKNRNNLFKELTKNLKLLPQFKKIDGTTVRGRAVRNVTI